MTSTEIRFASPLSTSFGHHLRPTQKPLSSPSKKLSSNYSFGKTQRSASFGSLVTKEEEDEDDDDYQEGMSLAGTDDLRERKRRLELEIAKDRTRITSNSPPTRMYARGSLDSSGEAVDGSASRRRNGHSSPKGHYPHSYGPNYEEDDAITKRRRIESEEMNYSIGRSAEEEEEYRRARMHGGRGYGGMEERYSGNYPHSEMHHRRSIGDDPMDPAVPLARRRGDAAQAKASRLHIDTGYGGQDQHDLFGRSSLSAGQAPSHGIKSAPPSKVTFSEREDVEFDPRREAFARAHGGNIGPQRREGSDGSSSYGMNNEGPNSVSSNRRDQVHYNAIPPNAAVGGGNGAGFRPGMVPGGTPLTASRAFVPQTATLPSPAYHTTKFIGQAGGAAVGPHSSIHTNTNSSNHSNAREQVPPGPRTAGFNPPATARLPDHLRSPPSNKTQFLSLFSNFYDSLQDSRTLKATLEDQVRRSNTLLQTLQRSARVLELTVERRLNSERSHWEQKIQALEERCHRLESKTGAGSPTPTKESGIDFENGVSNGSVTLEESEKDNKEREKDLATDVGKETTEVKSKEIEAKESDKQSKSDEVIDSLQSDSIKA